MATEVVMPKLGLTMEEGTILHWRKKPGDQVTQGETILEIETDKVTVDVESPAAGVLGALLSPEGVTVPVGQVITHVLAPGERAPAAGLAPAAAEGAVEATAVQKAAASETPVAVASASARRAVPASPIARRLAAELGVDLNSVVGSGPQGRIMEEDVRRAAEAAKLPAQPHVAAREPASPLSGIRKIAAERLTHSFTTAPHFYLCVEADAASLTKMRERLLAPIQEKAGVRITVSDLLVKIVARAIEEHPEVNAVWDGGGVRSLSTVDIGLAAATERGLIVPVLREANRKSLVQLARERHALVEKARAGNLSLQDVEGGSFTITNLGTFAVDQFNAIINPPQSAILAVGRIKERPFGVEGQLVLRPTVILTLSIDHRVLDGAQAAQFLSRVVALIEEPYLLMPIE
jgi:pyruvate dehydrogenase E2 component (dihydrolipoamide acetyltransferase)